MKDFNQQTIGSSCGRIWNVKNVRHFLQESVVSALMAAVVLTAAAVFASVGVLMAAAVFASEAVLRPSRQPA